MLLRFCLASLFLLWPLLVWAEKVTLHIENVASDETGEAITQALSQLPGVKVSEKITKEAPLARVTFNPDLADLSDLAQAVAGAKVASKEKPIVFLILGYTRFDESLSPDHEFMVPRVEEILGKLKSKGAVINNWKLQAKKKEFLVRLEGNVNAKLADFKAAFPMKGSAEFLLIEYVVK